MENKQSANDENEENSANEVNIDGKEFLIINIDVKLNMHLS